MFQLGLPHAVLRLEMVQALGLEAVLALARLPHVLSEGAAGRHGCRGGEAGGAESVDRKSLHGATGHRNGL